MKVLILGGTGAMGNYLVSILADRGFEVHVTTRQSRESESGRVKYIQGNAHELEFIRSVILEGKYDCVIDFMNYITFEFLERHKFFTDNIKHYIFLSSSRVYADSDSPIREDISPRLLDVSHDKKYLRTDEYALAKARQENLLMEGTAKNFTIIRPYITYSNERLQLGTYEKERWLYRALHNRPVIFSRDIASRFTTMTYGQDVAHAIAGLVNKSESFGEIYHITGDDYLKWHDIAEIYQAAFHEITGREMKIMYIDKALDDTAQVHYDRLYNRIFDNSKIKSVIKDFHPVSIREGLSKCLGEFIRDSHPFKHINWSFEIKADKITGTCAGMSELAGSRARAKYILERYCPFALRLINILRKPM